MARLHLHHKNTTEAMASDGFHVSSTALRIICICTYPFALGLLISYAVEATQSSYDPSTVLRLSFTFITLSSLFSLCLVVFPRLALPTTWQRAFKYPKNEVARRKIQVYSIFATDFIFVAGLLLSAAWLCHKLQYVGYYFEEDNSPQAMMEGTFATVPFWINMSIHGYFVLKSIYERFPVNYGGSKGTHAQWTGIAVTQRIGDGVEVQYHSLGAGGQRRIYRDLEEQSVGVTVDADHGANDTVEKNGLEH